MVLEQFEPLLHQDVYSPLELLEGKIEAENEA